MRKTRNIRWWRLVFGLATLSFPVLPMLFARMASYDCNEHSPAETFARYFGTVPPPGVRDIRTTGHISLGGADVWMRFRVADSDLATLVTGYSRLDPDDAGAVCSNLARQTPASPFRREGGGLPAEHRMRWDDLASVQNADVYSNSNGTSDNTLIYDRQRGTAYFYHWSQ